MIIEEKNKEVIKRKESEARAINQFIIDFNKEAKQQRSRWFTKFVYGYPHIIRKGWTDIAFQISYFQNTFIFVDNDYMIGTATMDANFKFFKYYKEFKSILEKIPQKFRILYNVEHKQSIRK